MIGQMANPVDIGWNLLYIRGMTTVTLAYVTDVDNKDDTHYVLRDGVSVLPNGCLILTYERDEKGTMLNGHIYAPGQWKQVSIQQEDQ